MISRSLARFIVHSRAEDIPLDVRREALRSVFNVIGTALGGSGDAGCQRIAATLIPFSGPAEATIIGRRERVDCLTASFLNALGGNVFDFDDTHPETIIHPSAPVVPMLFALGERWPMRGADLLHAFILGGEIECRLGNALSPGHYRRGWHITATCGVFGAAAAAGKALGLDEDGMLSALGHASAQSSGLVETLGTDAKSIGVGHSARAGLMAALLAKNGVAGPEMPIEGERGFLRVMGVPADQARVLAGLGEVWEIAKNTYKPYPCGVVLNPVIDACLALRMAGAPDPAAIEGVTVTGNPLLRQRTDRPDVATGREAQVSAQHAVAVVLIDGKAGLPEFSDARVRAPDVLTLRSKVRIIEDAEMSVDAASVEIRLRSGETMSRHVAAASGSSACPLDNGELEQKFRALCTYGAPGLDPDPLIEALWHLADAPDVASVIRLAGLD